MIVFFEIESIFEIYNSRDDKVINYFYCFLTWLKKMNCSASITYPNSVDSKKEHDIQTLATECFGIGSCSYPDPDPPSQLSFYLDIYRMCKDIAVITGSKSLSKTMNSEGIKSVHLNDEYISYSLWAIGHAIYAQYISQLLVHINQCHAYDLYAYDTVAGIWGVAPICSVYYPISDVSSHDLPGTKIQGDSAMGDMV